MTYTVTTETTFAASHYLKGHEGGCGNLHGHNWKVEVSVDAPQLDGNGFVIDFLVLDEIMKEAIAPFDHSNLNDVVPFDSINPTAENLASCIFKKVNNKIKTHNPSASISKITVWEMDKYRVAVSP